MKWFLILLLSVMASMGATTYTEFYCDASVSANNTNVNAGSTTGAPVYGPSVNGNWDGTSVFTPTDGSTPASTVSAGMWASVYLDAATVAVYIAQVTNVAAGANGAITLSQAAFAGTKPASGANGRTIRVGGSWKGPHAAEGFPVGFIATTATNNSSSMPCVNLKNAATYSITAAMTHANVGPTLFQGYTTNPHDGGRATFDGGTIGTSFVLLNVTGQGCDFVDLIFGNNGNSGSASLVNAAADGTQFFRCVFHDGYRSGMTTANVTTFVECEAYANNKSNAGGHGGYLTTAGRQTFTRCIAHDNSGANSSGFNIQSSGVSLEGCIADSNGADGFLVNISGIRISNSEFYNNAAAGIRMQLATVGTIYLENCNFLKNAAFGITNSAALRNGNIVNCGFGTGAMANGGLNIANIGGISESQSVTYASGVSPWVDPDNGDFRINLVAAKAAGRGAFTETQASYAGTVGYPDLGAAQSPSTNAAASGGSYTFSQ